MAERAIELRTRELVPCIRIFEQNVLQRSVFLEVSMRESRVGDIRGVVGQNFWQIAVKRGSTRRFVANEIVFAELRAVALVQGFYDLRKLFLLVFSVGLGPEFADCFERLGITSG